MNRSARTATDASQLSASDRLGLELSAYDQALLGLGGRVRRRPGSRLPGAERRVDGRCGKPAGVGVAPAGGRRDAPGRSAAIFAWKPRRRWSWASAPRCRCPAPSFPFRRARRSGSASLTGSAPPPAAAACAPRRTTAIARNAPAPVVATIDGHVVAADGAPLSAPRVTIKTAGETDAVKVDVDGDGRFAFDGQTGPDADRARGGGGLRARDGVGHARGRGFAQRDADAAPEASQRPDSRLDPIVQGRRSGRGGQDRAGRSDVAHANAAHQGRPVRSRRRARNLRGHDHRARIRNAAAPRRGRAERRDAPQRRSDGARDERVPSRPSASCSAVSFASRRAARGAASRSRA